MAPIIRPEDSATVDSASIISGLGYTPFNETGDTLTGTGGSGFYGAISQSSAPSTPASGFRLYANASGLLEWKGTNGFTRTFDGSANTSDRVYTLPNSSGTIALTSDLSSYFPVTGGSLTGTGGSGFYGAIPQSSAPSTPGSGFRLYANASGLLEWKGTNGFTRTFDGTANTANRAYTLPNSSGTIALEGTLTSLANPTIQNGFYQFVQNTKPTQRAAGVPLVAGDRWFNTSNGTEWFWNGTYWLSNQLFVVQGAVPSQVPTNSYIDSRGEAIVFSDFNSIFVERAQIVWEYTSYSESNYWQFQVTIDRGNVTGTFTTILINTYTTTSGSGNYELAVNTAYTFTSDYPLGIRVWTLKVGSPGNASVAQGYRYRLISP